MKKPIWIALGIAVLAGLAVFLWITKSGDALANKDWRDFAVDDTASITKLVLADRTGDKTVAERKGKGWVVNGTIQARADVVNIVLKTIKQVRTKSRVPKNARENVLKSLATKGVKVEIYTKGEDEPVKVYYVGSETPNQEGTYLMQEGSPEPFIAEIPGFNGYLSPRYPSNPTVWKDPVLFRYKPDEIAKIKINYVEFPSESFELVNTGNQNVTIRNAYGQTLPAVDRIMAQKYLGGYNTLVYEDEARGLSKEKVDSILSKPPFINMQVVDNKNKTINLSFYHIKNASEEYGEDGKLLPYNPDRLHVRVNNENKLYIVQYYVWDRALVPFTFFAPKK